MAGPSTFHSINMDYTALTPSFLTELRHYKQLDNCRQFPPLTVRRAHARERFPAVRRRVTSGRRWACPWRSCSPSLPERAAVDWRELYRGGRGLPSLLRPHRAGTLWLHGLYLAGKKPPVEMSLVPLSLRPVQHGSRYRFVCLFWCCVFSVGGCRRDARPVTLLYNQYVTGHLLPPPHLRSGPLHGEYRPIRFHYRLLVFLKGEALVFDVSAWRMKAP